MFAFCHFQTSRSFYCSPRPSVEMAGASRMSRAGATRWLALALALSCVARGAHAGTPKPETIVAKEFSFSDELDDAFVVALGSESAAVPLSPADLAALEARLGGLSPEERKKLDQAIEHQRSHFASHGRLPPDPRLS